MSGRRNTRLRKSENKLVRDVKKDVKKIVQKKPAQSRRRRKPMEKPMVKVTAPIGKGYNERYSKPKFKSKKDTIVVTHSEYLGTVRASDKLSQVKYRLNPTDKDTFPWLSTFGNAYEKWNIKSLKARYVANCSTTTFGKVFMYFDYDPNDTPPNEIGIILNTMDAKSGSPWVDKTVPFKKQFDTPKTYLVRSPYTEVTDYLLYDPANLLVGCVGTGANSTDPVLDLGEIWIDYTIELSIPDPYNTIESDNAVFTLNTVQSIAYQGGYVPDFSTAASVTYDAGNYFPSFQSGLPAIIFPKRFCGLIFMKLTASNGMDASRLITWQPTGGAQLYNKWSVMQDTVIEGDDSTCQVTQVISPAGGGIYLSNAILNTQHVFPWINICLYSCNPKWWKFPDPKILEEIEEQYNDLVESKTTSITVSRSKVSYPNRSPPKNDKFELLDQAKQLKSQISELLDVYHEMQNLSSCEEDM